MTSFQAINLSVGTLVQRCRCGDINFRFTSRSSAREGVLGHRQVQQSRGEGYIAEFPVSRVIRTSRYEITLSGRIDGIGLDAGQVYLDEIKTVRLAATEIPADVLDAFWLQARLYGFMLASDLMQEDILLRLCLYNLDTELEEILVERWQLSDLAQLFTDCVLLQVETLERRSAWQTQRSASLKGLAFPHDDYRPGQRDMAVAVYRAVSAGEQLVMQAPTGIGKTMGTIYPSLLALQPGAAERVFYLSARTSTQHLAEACVGDIRDSGARIRAVTITAKEKVCFNPGEPCHPDHCEYARGYYDRIRECIDTALESHEQFDREVIESVARDFRVCPFELALDLAPECDFIVADYNYIFDPVVYLRRFFEEGRTDSVILVDESHNLVDRGRDMFSAEISKQSYLRLAKVLRATRPALAKAVRKVNQAVLDWRRPYRTMLAEEGAAASNNLPEQLLTALQKMTTEAESELREEGVEPWREELLDVYFSSLRFLRTAEGFDHDYVTLAMRSGSDTLVKLFCVNPARQLGEGFDRLYAAVCFSATLKPQAYFQRLLGTADDARWYGLPSPFAPENLKVAVAASVDTSFRGREGSVAEVVEIIQQTISARSGNYLIFFPSHQYLERIYAAFTEACPTIPVMRQTRHMADADRERFLKAFDSGPVCGFAVMGGVFSEGIDLAGDRLIGAVIVGVGLPQIGIERDVIRDQFDAAGFEYAYQYPGMIRVLQTAGRVIRTETDRGVICLVDRRYREARYRALMPAEWQPELIASAAALRESLTAFWQGNEPDRVLASKNDPTRETLQVDTG